MPIPVADILSRASIVLQDEDYVRWEVPELLMWLNDAASEIVIRRPQARARVTDITLDDGPLQALPEGAIQLIDVVRNKPGRSISRVSRRLLDDQEPDWYDAKPGVTLHYTLEEETPTHFYVYPPAKAGALVEAKYSEAPPAVTEQTDTLDLDRAYIGPLVSYILYRAQSKDSEFANGAVAVAHFQAFSEALNTSNAVTAAVTTQAGTK